MIESMFEYIEGDKYTAPITGMYHIEIFLSNTSLTDITVRTFTVLADKGDIINKEFLSKYAQFFGDIKVIKVAYEYDKVKESPLYRVLNPPKRSEDGS